MAVGEETVMTDTVETFRQGVKEETTNERVGQQCHRLVLVMMAIIAPAKTHVSVFEREQPAVGNSDTVGIAAEIGQHLLRSAKGPFGIDNPVNRARARKMLSENLGIGEIVKELELPVRKRGLQFCQKQPPENT